MNTTAYDVRGDMDLDGDVDAADKTIASAAPYNGVSSGINEVHSLTNNCVGFSSFSEQYSLARARHRFCVLSSGQWSQRDLLDYKDGSNLYLYCRCRPVETNDPSGLSCTLSPGGDQWCGGGFCHNTKSAPWGEWVLVPKCEIKDIGNCVSDFTCNFGCGMKISNLRHGPVKKETNLPQYCMWHPNDSACGGTGAESEKIIDWHGLCEKGVSECRFPVEMNCGDPRLEKEILMTTTEPVSKTWDPDNSDKGTAEIRIAIYFLCGDCHDKLQYVASEFTLP